MSPSILALGINTNILSYYYIPSYHYSNFCQRIVDEKFIVSELINESIFIINDMVL
jgi:hypothetical protein